MATPRPTFSRTARSVLPTALTPRVLLIRCALLLASCCALTGCFTVDLGSVLDPQLREIEVRKTLKDAAGLALLALGQEEAEPA